MSRRATTRFGILGLLTLGFALGYLAACSNSERSQGVEASSGNGQQPKTAAKSGQSGKDKGGVQPKAAAAKADAKPERRKTYYPNTEELGDNEMRVISLGTGMPNQRKSQASACWLVELGNGDKFLFDLGTGSVANLSVLEIPYDLVNKVFVGHLHSDHVGDFRRWHIGGWVGGRQKAPRIWGPDGPKDHPEWGTKYFVDHQLKSFAWDIDGRSGRLPHVAGKSKSMSFRTTNSPSSSNENGVKISAWPAVHIMAGPVSFSLEWKNRKFCFSSDTFPNKWFIEYAKDADIVVHETFGTIRQNIDLQGWDRQTRHWFLRASIRHRRRWKGLQHRQATHGDRVSLLQ